MIAVHWKTFRLDAPFGCLSPALRFDSGRLGGRRTILAAWLICLFAGCSPYQLAKRTLHTELAQFPRVTEGRLACKEYNEWALAEWNSVAAESEAFSSDYRDGFLQGFVDQVYAGGNVRVPSMPPRKYWRMAYRNEAGKQAVADWYGGFEHGARVAKEKGYRDRAEIPSSLWMEPGYGGEEIITLGDADPIEGSTELHDMQESYEILPPAIEALDGEPTPADPQEAASTSVEPPAANESPMVSKKLESATPKAPDATPKQEVSLASFEAEPSSLPEETRQDLPPKPPWLADDSSAVAAMGSGSAAQANSDAESESSGFNPFAGTRFEAIADVPIGPQMAGLDLTSASASAKSRAQSAAHQTGARSQLPTIPIDTAGISDPTRLDAKPVTVASPTPANGWSATKGTDPSEGLPLLDLSSRTHPRSSRVSEESKDVSSESDADTPAQRTAGNEDSTSVTEEASGAGETESTTTSGWQVKQSESKTEWKSKPTVPR